MWTQAHLVKQYGVYELNSAIQHVPCGWPLMSWFHGWIRKIEREGQRRNAAAQVATKKPPAPAPTKPRIQESAGSSHRRDACTHN